MKNSDAILPLIGVGILIFLGLALIVVAWVIVAFTAKMVIALALVGIGVGMFAMPKLRQGLGPRAGIIIPLFLILLGVMFYLGVFNAFL